MGAWQRPAPFHLVPPFLSSMGPETNLALLFTEFMEKKFAYNPYRARGNSFPAGPLFFAFPSSRRAQPTVPGMVYPEWGTVLGDCRGMLSTQHSPSLEQRFWFSILLKFSECQEIC